jgi:serine/threonine-protein kinase RsbT
MWLERSMTTPKVETMPLRTSQDIVLVRQAARELTIAQGFSLVDQTKLVTAVSEIARNTVEYGGGGEARLEMVEAGARRGVRVTFSDHGPGIADLEQALRDGYTTGTGLGLGLSGARRLCNEFEIESRPGSGTRVTIARWR